MSVMLRLLVLAAALAATVVRADLLRGGDQAGAKDVAVAGAVDTAADTNDAALTSEDEDWEEVDGSSASMDRELWGKKFLRYRRKKMKKTRAPIMEPAPKPKKHKRKVQKHKRKVKKAKKVLKKAKKAVHKARRKFRKYRKSRKGGRHLEAVENPEDMDMNAGEEPYVQDAFGDLVEGEDVGDFETEGFDEDEEGDELDLPYVEGVQHEFQILKSAADAGEVEDPLELFV